jgi:hypothetical protein
MDDGLEAFVPLAFHRPGARRVATDDRHVHDGTLLEGVTHGFYWQRLVDRPPPPSRKCSATPGPTYGWREQTRLLSSTPQSSPL